jgi:hypothetical protein
VVMITHIPVLSCLPIHLRLRSPISHGSRLHSVCTSVDVPWLQSLPVLCITYSIELSLRDFTLFVLDSSTSFVLYHSHHLSCL